MRKSFIVLSAMCCLVNFTLAQVGIDTDSPHESAMLHLESDSKGFLPPRLTTVQRNVISDPSEGLVVFNTNTNAKCLQVYRNTTNGDGWFDMCCPEAVGLLNSFSAANILFTSDKFFTGINGTGGPVANNGEVGSVGPIDLSAFGPAYPSSAYFNQSAGALEPGFTVKYNEESTSVNDYSASSFLRKDGAGTTGADFSVDHLALDLTSITGGDVYTGDFTLSVVAKYNILPGTPFRAFLSIAETSDSPNSLEIGSLGINGETFGLTVEGTTVSSNAVEDPNPALIDLNFHLVNVVYDSSANKTTFYIDGEKQSAEITGESIFLQEYIRLLANRSASVSSNVSMAFFGVDPVQKSETEIQALSKSLQCLFEER